jgi:hypothetical protein
MSPVKEPMYFSEMDRTPDPSRPDSKMYIHAVRDLTSYRGLFADGRTAVARGEASVSYLADPDAPRRIHELIPDAKLIAILRHPAERTFSEYAFSRACAIERLPTVAEAVTAELELRPDGLAWRHFVEWSRYARHLNRYLAYFPRSRVRVFLYDDLAADPATLVRDLYEFLEVDASYRPESFDVFNAARPVPRHPGIARVLTESSRAKSALKHVMPAGIRRGLKRTVLQRDAVEPEFPGEVRRQLVEMFADDVRALECLIDRDLSGWLS